MYFLQHSRSFDFVVDPAGGVVGAFDVDTLCVAWVLGRAVVPLVTRGAGVVAVRGGMAVAEVVLARVGDRLPKEDGTGRTSGVVTPGDLPGIPDDDILVGGLLGCVGGWVHGEDGRAGPGAWVWVRAGWGLTVSDWVLADSVLVCTGVPVTACVVEGVGGCVQVMGGMGRTGDLVVTACILERVGGCAQVVRLIGRTGDLLVTACVLERVGG